MIAMPRNSPAQVTADQMDKSRQLENLVEQRLAGQYDALLSELQFAFVAFFLGQCYDAFEQWKRLVRLLCSCDASLWDQRLFFERFIGSYRIHL